LKVLPGSATADHQQVLWLWKLLGTAPTNRFPFRLLQVGCEKVTTGTVRRTITCLCFSADGNWLFAGTASGDVLTINVARRAVQVRVQLCVESLSGSSRRTAKQLLSDAWALHHKSLREVVP
jgi:hypothetical protein